MVLAAQFVIGFIKQGSDNIVHLFGILLSILYYWSQRSIDKKIWTIGGSLLYLVAAFYIHSIQFRNDLILKENEEILDCPYNVLTLFN
jgi:hypothetical protein